MSTTVYTSNSSITQLFGIRIHNLRTKKNLTQEELAHLADLSTQHLGGVERGEENPTLKTIEAIAKALEVPVHLLLAEEPLTLEPPDEPPQWKMLFRDYIKLPPVIQKVIRELVHILSTYFK